MKAILMAAGIGSRLSTNPDKPKCLWKVGAVPLIEHTVRMLTDNGIQVIVVIGFKQEMIRNALKNYEITFCYNPFFRATNSIASLWFAQQHLAEDDDVILANADVFFEQPILDLLGADSHNAMLLGDEKRVELGDYFLKTDADGFLVDHGKQLNLTDRSCEYVGIARLRSGFIADFRACLNCMIDTEKYHLWWENTLYENRARFPVYVRQVGDRFWGEIDYLQDYNRISDYLADRR